MLRIKYKKYLHYLVLCVIGAGLMSATMLAVPVAVGAIGDTTVVCNDGRTYPLTPGSTPQQICASHQGVNTTTGGGAGSSINALTPSCTVNANDPNACTDAQCSKGQANCTDQAASSDPNAQCDNNSCDLITKYVNPAIKLLTAIVGLVVSLSIIAGAIQYSTSEGDPQKAAKAKHRISMAIIALVAYSFLFAFLQFLIPGGI